MSRFAWFYTGKEWRSLCWLLRLKANNRCQRCNAEILDIKYLIGHHKIELTPDNIHNPSIALNPDNIEMICQTCHNKEHRRFGTYERQVYIVWGCPLSGKSIAVRDMMRPGDIVMDINELWRAVTLNDYRPEACKFNIFALRNALIDQIKTRYGQWRDAYIIGGYPDRYERERLAIELGAQLVYCEVDKAESFARAKLTATPEEYKKYVAAWWEAHERTVCPPTPTESLDG